MFCLREDGDTGEDRNNSSRVPATFAQTVTVTSHCSGEKMISRSITLLERTSEPWPPVLMAMSCRKWDMYYMADPAIVLASRGNLVVEAVNRVPRRE